MNCKELDIHFHCDPYLTKKRQPLKHRRLVEAPARWPQDAGNLADRQPRTRGRRQQCSRSFRQVSNVQSTFTSPCAISPEEFPRYFVPRSRDFREAKMSTRTGRPSNAKDPRAQRADTHLVTVR